MFLEMHTFGFRSLILKNKKDVMPKMDAERIYYFALLSVLLIAGLVVPFIWYKFVKNKKWGTK